MVRQIILGSQQSFKAMQCLGEANMKYLCNSHGPSSLKHLIHWENFTSFPKYEKFV